MMFLMRLSAGTYTSGVTDAAPLANFFTASNGDVGSVTPFVSAAESVPAGNNAASADSISQLIPSSAWLFAIQNLTDVHTESSKLDGNSTEIAIAFELSPCSTVPKSSNSL